MRPQLVPLALLVPILLLGCGSEAAPPPPPEQPRPATTPAPPPAPPPPPAGRTLLVASEFGLSPLACYFDQAQNFATGETCLPLAPVDAEVWLMTGTAAKVTGQGRATCAGERPPEPTLTLDAPREALRGDAVLPVKLKDALLYVAPTPPAEVDAAAPKELRARLTAAIKSQFPKLGAVKPRIDQRALVDLDGDGVDEALVVVTVPGKSKDEDADLRLSALFLVPTGADPELLRALEGTRERFTVIGSLDLDGDGTREIYLNTYDDHSFALSLERRAPDGLHALGRWSCD